jgi:carbonic anhydrase
MSVDLCETGMNQSPIEIDVESTSILNCAPNCDLKFFYKTSRLSMLIGEDSVVISYDPGSYILYNQTPYSLNQIHFTVPNVHKFVRGDRELVFSGEAILYHTNPDSGKTVALSVMLTVGNVNSSSFNFFAILPRFQDEPAGTKLETAMPESWNAYQLIPSSKSFYKYSGSLLKSPCTENITWIVFEYEVTVPQDFFNDLSSRVRNVTYSIKPLNRRIIYFSANEEASNNKNNITNEVCITADKLELIKEEERKKYEKVVSSKSAYEQRKMGYIIAMAVLLGVFILFLIIYKFFTRKGGSKGAPAASATGSSATAPVASATGSSATAPVASGTGSSGPGSSATGPASSAQVTSGGFFNNAANVLRAAAKGILRTTKEINEAVV